MTWVRPLAVWLFPVLLLGLLACQAPKDYYLEIAKMERLGEKLRQESGPGTPAPDESSVAHAFEPGDAPSEMLSFRVRSTAVVETPVASERIFRAQVPVAVNQQALQQTLSQKGIVVTGVRSVDGRLKGQVNVLRITFVPQVLSDESIYEAYLLITAVIRGADSREGTVDQVIAIAEDQSANARMILEGKIQDYRDYVETQKITQQEWLNRLGIRRF